MELYKIMKQLTIESHVINYKVHFFFNWIEGESHGAVKWPNYNLKKKKEFYKAKKNEERVGR